MAKASNFEDRAGQLIDWDALRLIDGQYPNMDIIHKFGRNDAVSTSHVPVSLGANYRTPLAATALEIVSTSANDVAAGSGARVISVLGLDENFNEVTEEVTLNGTTAVALSNSYLRIFRAYVKESGTYATQLAGSHAGDITIRETGGGDAWCVINGSSSFPKGQTQIGAYTIPAGKIGYVSSLSITSESSKPADILFFQRQNADDVAEPYDAMRLQIEFDGVVGSFSPVWKVPIGPFPAKTDIGFLAKLASGSGAISVNFEIILIDVE